MLQEWSVLWRRLLDDASLWRTLDLSNSQRPGPTLRFLAKQPRLRSALTCLQLEFAAGVTDEMLLPLRGLQLETLNLNGCQQCGPALVKPGVARASPACLRGAPATREGAAVILARVTLQLTNMYDSVRELSSAVFCRRHTVPSACLMSCVAPG